MNSKSVKGRGKRFLAGFLALLMAVTLLPANVAGVAYAEELDAIETEAPDGVVAADEETEAAGSVVAADEETEEPQVNEGESSEEVKPEEGLTVNTDEEDLALEEVVPELEAAVAVASEEALEPAEVSAAVTADTSKYVEKVNDDKVRSWTFDKASAKKWVNKDDGNTTLTADHDLDGIKLSAGTVTLKPTETSGSGESAVAAPNLTLSRGGKIDIPVDDDTDAIAIEITITSRNAKRYILIGVGAKQDKVYQKDSTTTPNFDNNKFYTNENLYLKTDNMFSTVQNDDETSSTVLSIEAGDDESSAKEFKIASIVLHEYKEEVESVTFDNGTTVELSVGEDDDKSTDKTTYTGKPINFNVVVTNPGEDGATTTVNPKAYSVSYYRQKTDGSGDYEEEATKDLTSAGIIKAVVTSIGDATTADSDEFEIEKAQLAEDNTIEKEISIAATQIAQYKTAELNLAALIKPLSEEDTFAYTLVTDNGYVAGDVVSGTPEIDNNFSKLKYAVDQNADTNSTATVLVVKVESANYEPAYIKVTVSIANKTAVTVSGNTVAHTYNGAAYGYKANAKITLLNSGLDDTALAAAIADVTEHLTYKFTKLNSDGTAAGAATTEEPKDAGTYKVEAELETGSNYTLDKFVGGTGTEENTYVDAKLIINPKTITVKPNDVTWDKLLKGHPEPPTEVKSTDYTIVGDGLVGTDKLDITGMTIKYCKHGTKTEMTEAEWDDLDEDDVVDIVADGATASDNYKIEFAVGTINVMIRTVTQIAALTDKKSTFLASDITADIAGNKLFDTVDSNNKPIKQVKGDVLVNGFLVTGDADNFTTLQETSLTGAGNPAANYTARLKSGASGNQYYKSIGFTIDKPATLYIVGASDSGSDDRSMALYKLNEATKELAECVGTKYSKDTTTDLEYAAYDPVASNTPDANNKKHPVGGIVLDSTSSANTKKSNYLNIELTEGGTYYLAAAASGIVFYEVSVTYKDNTVEFATDPTLSTSQGATLTTPHPDDVLTVSYALDLATGKTDDSTIAWYRVKDGQETPLTADAADTTGKTYTVKAEDVGSKIKVVVTPKDSAGATGTAKNAETGTVRAAGEENIAFATAPALSISDGGSLTAPKPDDILTVSYALNAQGTDASTVEWYRGDTKIDTATGKTYTVTTADVGSVITVKVTPKIADGEPGTAETASTGTVVSGQQGGTITLTDVTLSGEAKVGKMLTANLTFDPAQATVPTGVTYQWYRGADLISGATNKSYTLTADDEGKTVKVVVTYGETTKEAATAEAVAPNTSNINGNGIEIEFDEGSTYIYTGAKITPSITVYNNGTPLVEGVDYTVKYTNNLNASEKVNADGTLSAITENDKKWPTVTVTGKGALSKKVTANFKIVPKDLNNDDYESAVNAETVAKVSAGASAVENKKATLVMLYGGAKLAVKKNFEYDDTTPANATDWDGEKKLKLNGVNNFKGSVEITVNVIAKADQANAKIKKAEFKNGDTIGKDAVKNLYYNGNAHKIDFEVSTKGGLTNAADATDPLVEDTDYVISYPEDLTNVGTKKVTITGISSRCTGSVTKTYKVIPADKNGGEFVAENVNPAGYDYVSTGVTFKLTGDDEDVVTFKYVPKTSDNENGRAISTYGEELVPGKDFKISYSNNKKVGDAAKYTVTGLGNYKGVVLKDTFTIKGISLTNENKNIKVTVADAFYNRNGAYKSVPYVTVNVDGQDVLLKSSEYVVSYTLAGEGEEPVRNKTRKIEDEDFGDGDSITVTVTIEKKGKNVVEPGSAETALTETFSIIKKTEGYDKNKDLSKAKIIFFDGETKNKVGYTGKEVYPTSMTVNGDTVALDATTGQPSDATKKFKIVYANNVAKGKATAVVMADEGSDYVGGKAATFNIVPKVLDPLPDGEGFIITSFMKGLFGK